MYASLGESRHEHLERRFDYLECGLVLEDLNDRLEDRCSSRSLANKSQLAASVVLEQ